MAEDKKSGGHPFLILIGIIVLIFFIRSQGGVSEFIGSSGSLSDTGGGSGGDTTSSRVPTQREQLSDIEEQIEGIAEQIEDLNASPYRGTVELRRSRAREEDADREYILLYANSRLNAPVNIRGWRLVNVTEETQIVLDNDLERKARFGGIPRARYIIERGDTVYLFTSDDPDNEPRTDYAWYLYADERRELWEDDDTVLLIDNSNRLVDSLEI